MSHQLYFITFGKTKRRERGKERGRKGKGGKGENKEEGKKVFVSRKILGLRKDSRV